MVDTFGENIDKISQKAADLKILILGAYRPRDMFKRLEGIRDCLRHKGFINTYLVENLPDEPRFDEDYDIHWTHKSNFWMKNFDINLFIFFVNCDNSGAVDELNYFINNIGEFFRCIAIYEEESTEKISSRIRAKIKEFNLRNVVVGEGEDMIACELICGFINIVSMKEKERIYKNSPFLRT